eukprot:SAG11_NODE_30189_length_303_cov_0.916667_1_plen_44_part_01
MVVLSSIIPGRILQHCGYIWLTVPDGDLVPVRVLDLSYGSVPLL